MRVTEFQVFQNSINFSNRARERIDRAAEVATSGLRVHRPWDDPAAAGRVAYFRASEAQFSSIAKTASYAQDQLQAADIAFSEVEDVMQHLRTLAVQMTNDHARCACGSQGQCWHRSCQHASVTLTLT